MDQLVVLRHDLDDATDGRWNAVTFTTVSRLLVFQKIIEVACWKKSITTQIDGTTLLDETRFLIHGASDYKHQFFSLMFGIVREECKESAVMIVETSMKIFTELGLPSDIPKPLRHDILKDGGTSLHAIAKTLCLGERACKVHMVERKGGVGTTGQNDCGSMYRYIQSKRLKLKDDANFFLNVNPSLFLVHGHEAYRTAVLMMFKYMLADWVVQESGGVVKAFVQENATKQQVIDVLANQFFCYIPFVSGETRGDLMRERREGDIPLHKCERIIVWFIGFYFRIGISKRKVTKKESSSVVLEPTYGLVHVPGDPDGLESQNNVMQSNTK